MNFQDETIIKLQNRIAEMEQELQSVKYLHDDLLDGQSRFNEVTDNIQQVFWMTDPKKNSMLFLSKAYEQIWGKSCQGTLENPMSFIESIHPEDIDRVLASFPQQIEGTYDIEYRIINAEAEIRWIHDKAFPIKNTEGELYRVVGFAQDITEKKRLLDELRIEKEKSDYLLHNILPEEVAEELKLKGSADPKYFDSVTVLFTDFKGFTKLSEKLTPKELVFEINECFSAFDHIMQKHGVEKIKTIGDAYMAVGGIPTTNDSHATDAVHAALAIQQYMNDLKLKKQSEGKLFFEMRVGVHTGTVVAGIVGVKKFAYDIWGDTVNTASRMESSGEIGKVNISKTTYDLVKDNFNCEYRGKIMAKNKGEIDMYFVEPVSSQD
jgi:PAS domain S-box-containing protein